MRRRRPVVLTLLLTACAAPAPPSPPPVPPVDVGAEAIACLRRLQPGDVVRLGVWRHRSTDFGSGSTSATLRVDAEGGRVHASALGLGFHPRPRRSSHGDLARGAARELMARALARLAASGALEATPWVVPPETLAWCDKTTLSLTLEVARAGAAPLVHRREMTYSLVGPGRLGPIVEACAAVRLELLTVALQARAAR